MDSCKGSGRCHHNDDIVDRKPGVDRSGSDDLVNYTDNNGAANQRNAKLLSISCKLIRCRKGAERINNSEQS